MIRRAYINWQKLTEETELENRKEYMVCVPSDNETASLKYAAYYDKGTMIDIPMAEGAEPAGKEPTAEERLLKVLFGVHKPFVVPEDGFYVLTADYGISETENNGAFAGCTEQAICLGNRYGWNDVEGALPIYWAETPLLPDGLKLDNQKTTSDPIWRPSDEKEIAELMERIASDPVMNPVYKHFCKETVPGDGAKDYLIGQAVYSVTPRQIAHMVDSAWAMSKALSEVSEQAFLDIRKKVKGMTVEDGTKTLADFCEKHHIPGPGRRLMFHYTDYLQDNCKDFYYHRDKQMAAGGMHSLNMPAVLQEAWAKSTLPYRVGRLVKLVALEAPEVILINELQILVERLLATKCGDRIVCVGSDFDAMYGVFPDGSRGTRHCEYGDKELYLIPEEPDPNEELPEDEEMDVPEELQDEEEPEPVLGVDYPWFAITLAPNFLMRKCRFVLWDNAKGVYLRNVDGEIETFNDWNLAKARSEELGATAEAAKNK